MHFLWNRPQSLLNENGNIGVTINFIFRLIHVQRFDFDVLGIIDNPAKV
jgi:hypothetical protein